MIVEMHCHTSDYSACSHVNAIELVQRASEMGFQAIVITDHHYCWTGEQIAELRRKAGLPEIFQVWAGQEYNTADYGDILVYGVQETIPKNKETLAAIREKYPDAAIIWAHPYRYSKPPDKRKLLNPLLDGIEIFSSNYTVSQAARALKDWHSMKFTAIAGTDTHALSYTGSYPTLFDHPVHSIEELVSEIKAGRCRPFFKEIPRSGTTNVQVTEITMGPKHSKERREVVLKSFASTKSWKHGERSHYLMKEIYNNGFSGGSYRVPQPLDQDKANLSLIEERVSGQTLFDMLITAEKEKARQYLKLAAQWISKLHNQRLKLTPLNEYQKIEPGRLDYYLHILEEENHKFKDRVREIRNQVWAWEKKLIRQQPQIMVQGHGDFHLKNIYIGYDEKEKAEYAAVIDFDSSFQLPPAFDVGTFLAQYMNMFFNNQEVTKKAPADYFLNSYLESAQNLSSGFLSHVELYKARAFLSVIYYLVKVGLSDSENFWRIMVAAEQSLAHVNVKGL
ncbi:MAG: phosphotransferase [Calditrichia bacterium]